eukprot:5927823-Pleurochrysis_carterae.AAC.1
MWATSLGHEGVVRLLLGGGRKVKAQGRAGGRRGAGERVHGHGAAGGGGDGGDGGGDGGESGDAGDAGDAGDGNSNGGGGVDDGSGGGGGDKSNSGAASDGATSHRTADLFAVDNSGWDAIHVA